MGKKKSVRDLPWFRHYPKDYLGDLAILQLDFLERGVLHTVNSILWAHTDEAGFYSINGVAGTEEELVEALRSYSGSAKLERRKSISSAIKHLVSAGHLVWGVDGVLYSKYLVSLISKCELQAERGAKGGRATAKKEAQVVPPKVNPKAGLESESERELDIKTTVTGINSTPAPVESAAQVPKAKKKQNPHHAPDRWAFEMRDYQTEVLNKCTGKKPGAEHPKAGLLWKIGKEVPSEILYAAASTMQDARNNNMNGEREPVRDLEAYYFATLKGMCKDEGVITSFWKD